jgi:hypothetical protein
MTEQGKHMGWDLTGLIVWARYLEDFPVCGRVESSRVKYGGGVQHTVVLNEPVTVFGAVRDRLLIDSETVTRVASNYSAA